jgi:hypothetical protein
LEALKKLQSELGAVLSSGAAFGVETESRELEAAGADVETVPHPEFVELEELAEFDAD